MNDDALADYQAVLLDALARGEDPVPILRARFPHLGAYVGAFRPPMVALAAHLVATWGERSIDEPGRTTEE